MKDYAHQEKIIAEDPTKCGLFLGTGSGKTRIALSLARGTTLVIAPKTQVEDKNWEREWEKLVQQRAQEASDFPRIKKLVVIQKEFFRRDWNTLPAFDTVIVDEAHTCLGVTPNTRQRKRVMIPKTSQLFEALDEYIHKHKPKRLYLVTATIMKSPMTVWGAGKLLGHYWDYYKFRDTFYTRLPMPGREVWVPKNAPEIKNRLATLVRQMGYVGRLDDFFDVPAQTFKKIHIELTAAQKERIKEVRLEYPDPIVQVGKRHQIENGVLAGDEFNKPEAFDTGKTEKLLELAIEYPRMVIFAKYRAQIDLIASEMKRGGHKVLVLTGDTKDRGTLLVEANRLKECIFIAQAQISAGWELPEYPLMVFASKTYSFVDYDQALGRIQRANNIKKNLYVSLVTKGGVDEAVEKSVDNKKDFNERIYITK